MGLNVRHERIIPATYSRPGSLRELIRVHSPGMAGRVWTGDISVLKRMQVGELQQADLDEVLSDRVLNRYYVVVDLEAPTRCIDGRCICNYVDNKALHWRPLGGQVPGGSATAALCRRVADTSALEDDRSRATLDDAITESTFAADIDDMRRIMDIIHWKAGGHTGDSAAEGQTGCGAIDKIPEILQRITSGEAQSQLRGLVRLLLGENYHEKTVDELMGRFLALQGHADVYFARDESGNYTYRTKVIEKLKVLGGGVEDLSGTHNEIALVVNLVEGTTFDRDQFAVDHDGRLQIFNYDFWLSLQLAESIPRFKARDVEDPLTLEEHIDLRNRFITSRALFAVATAMVLTDGTLELIVRDHK